MANAVHRVSRLVHVVTQKILFVTNSPGFYGIHRDWLFSEYWFLASSTSISAINGSDRKPWLHEAEIESGFKDGHSGSLSRDSQDWEETQQCLEPTNSVLAV